MHRRHARGENAYRQVCSCRTGQLTREQSGAAWERLLIVKRNVTRYTCLMIGSIRHKGLKRLYEDGDARSIGANMRKRVSEILSVLDAANSLEEIDIPGYRLHSLIGKGQGYWSIKVVGNWRVTFRFQSGLAEDVNLEDYH